MHNTRKAALIYTYIEEFFYYDMHVTFYSPTVWYPPPPQRSAATYCHSERKYCIFYRVALKSSCKGLNPVADYAFVGCVSIAWALKIVVKVLPVHNILRNQLCTLCTDIAITFISETVYRCVLVRMMKRYLLSA
jgi:hypothetical protein